MQSKTRLAAVDLGSNSFRLEIGKVEHGQYLRTEYLKETVRQGGSLDPDRNLTEAAMQRGWDCLARFAEKLAGYAPHEVRAVATQTLREARNRDAFLAPAISILGFPIDVISGREEARLIYQGVAHTLPDKNENRLVVDIGGRSTELILGQGLDPARMESYRLGSISWSERYFPQQQFTPQAFRTAEIAAKAVLDEALDSYRPATWEQVYGSAGTVNALADVLTLAGWPKGLVTQDGLDWLLEQLLIARHADRLNLNGMKEDRRAILGGGLSVVRALFDLLQLKTIQQTTGGLRHGLMVDLMGPASNQIDLRSKSVQRLAAKFGIDEAHGNRVSKIALLLLTQFPSLGSDLDASCAKQLSWAALLHEIGSRISHSDYHKHGAYILDNADILGFSQSELHTLSMLILGQKGKLRKVEDKFASDLFLRQLICLRLAIIFCHARRDPDLTGLRFESDTGLPRAYRLHLPTAWFELYPQSAHLLREESLSWQKAGWFLRICPD